MMRAAMEKGQWVFFQNCHLSPSWMPTLERLVEQVDPDHVRLIYLYLKVNSISSIFSCREILIRSFDLSSDKYPRK